MKQRPSFPARLATPPATGRRPSAGTNGPASPAAAHILKSSTEAARAHAPKAAAADATARPSAGGSEMQAPRRHMVHRLSRDGVGDPRVLAAMEAIERHRFVDSALRGQAYEDTSLPIGLGQTISKPGVVARMIELLRNGAAGKLGRVLEIGTGCGYQAAVLSLLASEVYSMERLRGLHEKARENLRPLRLPNVHLLFGDGMAGFAKGAPYAGIIAAACGDTVPQAWTEQLMPGGRLVAPIVLEGAASRQQALLVVEKTVLGLRRSVFEAVHFVPLKSGVA